jgi:hypothetical protein
MPLPGFDQPIDNPRQRPKDRGETAMATRTKRGAGHNTSRLAGAAALALIWVPAGAQQAPADTAQPLSLTIPPVNVIGASPLLGSGVDRDTVPAETNVLTGGDLTRGGTLITPDVTMRRSAASTSIRPRATPISRRCSTTGSRRRRCREPRRASPSTSTASASTRRSATRSISTCCPIWRSTR